MTSPSHAETVEEARRLLAKAIACDCEYDYLQFAELPPEHKQHTPACRSQQTESRLIRTLLEALTAAERAQERLREIEAFLEHEGYRRCDIAACNCNRWHGGHASNRLREISDSLADAGATGTIHGGVLQVIARADAADQRLSTLLSALRSLRDEMEQALAESKAKPGTIIIVKQAVTDWAATLSRLTGDTT